jgi:hypothetical protein
MSKQLFELMREQESFPIHFGKKDYISRGKEIVSSVLKDGEIDKMEFWTKVAKIKETINAMDSQLREQITLTEKTTLNNVEFNPVQGGFVINYDEDIVYQEFKKQLKEREELLKLAQRIDVFDAYGNDVPKVSTTPRKSSITIKF